MNSANKKSQRHYLQFFITEFTNILCEGFVYFYDLGEALVDI